MVVARPFMKTGSVWTPKTDGAEALYVPLWHPTMTGTTIYSKDRNRHSCTVTGAVWGKYGRTLDGNDYINCGDDTSLDITDKLTLIAWMKLTSIDAYHAVITRDDGGAAAKRNYEMYIENRNNMRFEITTGAATKNSKTPEAGMAADIWYHLAGTYDRVSLTAYLDGVPDATPTAESGAIDNTDVSLYIGVRSDLSFAADAIIGEAWVYPRAFTQGDITRHRQETKWRYEG